LRSPGQAVNYSLSSRTKGWQNRANSQYLQINSMLVEKILQKKLFSMWSIILSEYVQVFKTK